MPRKAKYVTVACGIALFIYTVRFMSKLEAVKSETKAPESEKKHEQKKA